MSYLLNNEQKLNEIIFAHRNKAYGAYVLRSDYGFTIAKSLALVMSGVASLAFIAYAFTENQVIVSCPIDQVKIDSVYVIPFGKKIEEKVIPKTKTTPPPSTPPETKKPDQNGAPLVMDSTAVDNSTAVINNTVSSLVSTSTTITGDNPDPKPDNVIGDKPDVDIHGIANPFGLDKEAEFEGGLAALYKFIRDNLRYPEQAYDAGVDGSVFVKFVVDENGKVSRLTLLNTRGYGLDEEALRVVGMIPKFKSPAMMKGHAVKSYFQVPIRFRIAH